MHKTRLSLTAAAMVALMAGAQAQAPADFASIDADKSGEVSIEELGAAGIAATPEQFAAVDTDGSGGLNEQEFAAAITPR